MFIGPNDVPSGFPASAAYTLYVRNFKDSLAATRVVIQAAATNQGSFRLLDIQDNIGNARWGARSDAYLFIVPKGTFANNAAALAGGLVANDVYAVTGTDPRQLAVVF
jgi:hypothetical protein